MRLHTFPKQLALLLVLILSASVVRAQDAEFTPLAEPKPTESPGKIEVIEFFWYGCPHCNSLEPRLEAWERKLPTDVVLRREHVVWSGRKETTAHARLFLTLRTMNLLKQQHRAVFDAIHKDKARLDDESKVFDWAASRGIDKAKFESTYKSFGVQAQLSGATIKTRDYAIDSVPAFIVNGKYKTSLGDAKGPDRLFAVLDELIAKERAKK